MATASPPAPYVWLARNSFLASLAFRWRIIIGVFARVIELLIKVYLWRALYGGRTDVAGIGFRAMVPYLVLGALLGVFTGSGSGNRSPKVFTTAPSRWICSSRSTSNSHMPPGM